MNKTILFSISAATLGLCALVGLSKQTPMEAKAGTGPTSGSISSKQTINLKDNTESEIRSYYSALNGLDASELQGENLLKNLKPILQDFTYYTYDNVWKIYEITDREWSLSPASDTTYGTYDSTNNRIVDYQYGSNSNQKNNPWIHTLYRNRDENNVTIESGRIKEWAYDGMDSNKIHSQTGGTNREHVWCQSRGFKAPKGAEGPAGTDVHHLISGDGYVNGTPHNNNPYGFVDRSKSYTDSAASYAYCAGNYAGKALNPHSEDVSTTVFEPQDSDKGDIARACFYMVACYNNLAGLTGVISDYNPNLTMADYATDSGNSEASSDTHAVNMGILSDLLEWHRMDPVDDYEIHRNNLIYNNYQRNRNPFIDFPEWVDFIWGKASFNESTHKVISYDPTPTGSADPTKDAVGGYNAPTPVDPDEPSNLYEKATSIEAGDVVSFVYEGGQIALSSFSSNYATGTAVEIDDGRFLSENALAFTVEDGSLLGTYAFSKMNGDDKQYLAYSGSSTGLTLSNTLDSNATWTVAFDNGKAQVVNCGASTRGLIYRLGTYNRFACYANNNASSTSTEYFHAQIYTQLPASEEAAIWAAAFLSTWTAGCNSAGGYDSASMDWAAAKTAYNALSSGAKSVLQTSGYGTTDVGKAAERYDYIVGKYGTSAFEDFLGRSPSPIQHAYLIASFLPPAGTAALGIAFLIAASGIIVLATTLRKRKEK